MHTMGMPCGLAHIVCTVFLLAATTWAADTFRSPEGGPPTMARAGWLPLQQQSLHETQHGKPQLSNLHTRTSLSSGRQRHAWVP